MTTSSARPTHLSLWCLWLGLSALSAGGCAKTTEPVAGSSESHFLMACDQGACAEDLTCVCGVCTRECGKDESCAELATDAICAAPGTVIAACAEEMGVARVCDLPCERNGDCPSDAPLCQAGRCRTQLPSQPDPVAPAEPSDVSAGAPAPAPQSGGECSNDDDCPLDFLCGYLVAAGCGTAGTCLPLGFDGDVGVGPQIVPVPDGVACSCQDEREQLWVVRGIFPNGIVPNGMGGLPEGEITHVNQPSYPAIGPCTPPPDAPTMFPTQPDLGLLCSLPPFCSQDASQRLPVLVEADALDGVSRFVAISKRHGYVLAELAEPEGQSQVVVELSLDGEHRMLRLPESQLSQPLRLSDIDAAEGRVAVLQCDADRCELWRAESGAESFALVSRLRPAELGESALFGISALGAGCEGGRAVCVHGNGIHCLGEMEPETALPPDREAIYDVEVEDCLPVVAVGAGGKVMRYHDDAWFDESTWFGGDYAVVAELRGRTTAFGDLTVYHEGLPDEWMPCQQLGTTLVAAVRLQDPFNCPDAAPEWQDSIATHLTGLDVEGRLYWTEAGCELPERWGCGPGHPGAVDLGIVMCGAAENPVIVAEQTLYGRLDCLEVP